MSLEQRISKLEQKRGKGSLAAYPILLDADGVRLESNAEQNEVADVRYKCGDLELTIHRNKNEAFDAFKTRAHQDAQHHFDCVVVLPFEAIWL